MYVHSVKLVNFRSFGEYQGNEVILEPRVTAIIGKNESGKSNVLDGLSRIRFRTKNADAFSPDIVNRIGSAGKENQYHITLKPSEKDLKFGICGDTEIEIFKTGYSATGGFLTYYLKEVSPDVDALVEILGEAGANPLQLNGQELTNYRVYYSELLEKTKIDVPRRTAAFTFLLSKSNKIAVEKREQLKAAIETAQSKWVPLIQCLPAFFYRKADRHLSSLYKYEDIEKELNTPDSHPNSLLSDFVKVIGIPNEDFLLAAKTGTASTQNTVRNRIKRLTNTKINNPFADFYQTEEIFLDVDFNGGTIVFQVRSGDGEALSIAERSNGLRWYLETFIEAQAHDISGQNVVYLLDEPGTSLHVNAQKELLRLFGHLADQGNQVVYTTHSPYMLDLESEGVHRIRAVVKDNDGFSRIYRNAYDARIAPESQQDTLAPIISALGMNLHDTFGPAKDKVNIVTEGMSDYIYLSTMAKVLGVDLNTFTIIPSVGASNCVNICQILHGWGCRYLALFDYDKAGVESGGEHMRKEMFFECGKQYCYVKDVSQEEIEKKTYKTESCMIENVMIQSEIDRFYDESGTSKDLGKPLTAKLMCTAIENGSFVLNQASKDNFQALFDRIASFVAWQ